MAEIEINNYQIHKQLFSQMKPLDDEKLGEKLAFVGSWFSAHMKQRYFMLMCKEENYYTVLNIKDMNYSKAVKELRDLLTWQGDILDIRYVHGEDAYECWVKDEDEESKMFYLFVYDWGVIEIE